MSSHTSSTPRFHSSTPPLFHASTLQLLHTSHCTCIYLANIFHMLLYFSHILPFSAIFISLSLTTNMASIYSQASNPSLFLILPIILLFSTLTFLFIIFSLALLVLRIKKRHLSLNPSGRYRRLTRITPNSAQLFLPSNDDHLNYPPIDLTDMDLDGGLAAWATEEPGGQQAAIERYIDSLDQSQMAGLQRSRGMSLSHHSTPLIALHRLPVRTPSSESSNSNHSLPISHHPRKRRLRMVFRTRLRIPPPNSRASTHGIDLFS